MKCYYSASDAIGTCKSCGRGLSREFAAEYPKGLACKNRCERDVEALIAMIDRSVMLSPTSASIVRSNVLTITISGLFFIFMGAAFLFTAEKSRGFDLGFYMGYAFLAFGSYYLFRAYRTRKAAAK
jgi:hypothetical protein